MKGDMGTGGHAGAAGAAGAAPEPVPGGYVTAAQPLCKVLDRVNEERRGKENVPLGDVTWALTSTLGVVDLSPINALPSTVAILERVEAWVKEVSDIPLRGTVFSGSGGSDSDDGCSGGDSKLHVDGCCGGIAVRGKLL